MNYVAVKATQPRSIFSCGFLIRFATFAFCCPRPSFLFSSFILLPSLLPPLVSVFDVIENVYPYPSPLLPTLSLLLLPPSLTHSPPLTHPLPPSANPSPLPPTPLSPSFPQDPPVRSSVFSGYLSVLQRLIMGNYRSVSSTYVAAGRLQYTSTSSAPSAARGIRRAPGRSWQDGLAAGQDLEGKEGAGRSDSHEIILLQDRFPGPRCLSLAARR